MNRIKGRILTGAALLFSFALAVTVWAITIQSLGVDSTNKATIISGLLSMFGGMVGAFSAYLIARAQITKQLDLQDKKDRNRVLLETRLRKAEEVLEVLTRTKMAFFGLQGSWTSILHDHLNYIADHLREAVVYENLRNEELLEAIDHRRDEFITTYSGCYKYRPYFPDLIGSIERDHNNIFKNLTLDINSVLYVFIGGDSNFQTYEDLLKAIEGQIIQINSNFKVTMDMIDIQIINTENEINNLLINFEE
ncbi:hypothetical protein WQ57_02040 [Mesobacillus campisalis]|uniref:Uncharacterized protein n=1 Tax=Mesobacillus campisalis TaxID=1408103 RepID=A0A0M2SZ88_9BACI|nr:hypothetical protein [Mesobacillus campisalis]KKK39493.1 hypothetical protein WQ57_02040 [Mesobacillus campisalis]